MMPRRLVGALATFLFLGCSGGEPKRFPLHGTVTYAGVPIPIGDMRLEPDTERGGVGPGGYARIVEGRFETDPAWGVVGGPYIVRIVAGTGRNANPVDPLGTPLFRGEYRTPIDLPKERTEILIDIPTQP